MLCTFGRILRKDHSSQIKYDILIEKFSLEASQTLFIDDRRENVDAAAEKGIEVFHFDRNDYAGSCEKLREMLL